MAVTTTKPDKYDRYLADVFYPKSRAPRAKIAKTPRETETRVTTPHQSREGAMEILKEGRFLNKELVDRGLARRA